MDFNSRVSNIKIGGKKSVEQFIALKIIMNLYNPQDYVLQFFKDYSMIMNNVRYNVWCGKGIKVLTCKQRFQKSPIFFAWVKAGNRSYNVLNV